MPRSRSARVHSAAEFPKVNWKVDWLNWAWSREYPFSKSTVLQMSDKIWKADVVEIAVNADAVEQKKFGAIPGEQNSNLSSEELEQLRKWVEICR